MFYPPTLFIVHQCQVTTRVPPNTSVDKNYSSSEVIEGTLGDS